VQPVLDQERTSRERFASCRCCVYLYRLSTVRNYEKEHYVISTDVAGF
jgi:hypothetical protein